MTTVELLAPAGSLEILKAAIYCGADAVYIGGKNFGARAFAQNFNHEEIIEAVNFCHYHSCRLYVTMNTLLNEFELEAAMKEVSFLYEAKVDALIIQDLGLYYRITKEFPDMEIHASTQMHIHNLAGVKAAKKLGFKRLVLARESSLDLIKEACKEDIEIETFVHGAICVSYSGQCLMSSQMKNRSGNKGVCAQCCRLPYEVYDNNDSSVSLNQDKYILSPKDMNLLKHVPELIDAGVKSFKIEGRMKKKAYVCYITSLYRQAIDAYYANLQFKITKDMNYHLRSLFQRDFTDAYLTKDTKQDFFSSVRPNHLGISIGKVVACKNNEIYIKLCDNLHQFDGIRFLNKNDDGMMINFLYKGDNLVNSAYSGDVVMIKTDFKVSKGIEVVKTSDYLFENEFEKLEQIHRLPLDIRIIAKVDKPLILKASYKDINITLTSEQILAAASKLPANEETIYKQLNKLKETPYFIQNVSYDLENVFIPNGIINVLRREMVKKIDGERLNQFCRVNFKVDYEIKDPLPFNDQTIVQKGNIIKCHESNYYFNPVVNLDGIYSDKDYQVVSEIGGLFLDINHKIAYFSMNIANSYAYEFLKKIGFEAIILSSELNDIELEALLVAYQKRNPLDIAKPFILKDGKRVLMYLNKNPFQNYLKSDLLIKNQLFTYDIDTNEKVCKIVEHESFEHINDNFNTFIIK